MAEVVRARSYIAVGSVVFIRGFGVVGDVEAVIPEIHPRDLVAGVAAPTRSPEDSLGHGSGHDLAAVIGHVRIPGGARRLADHNNDLGGVVGEYYDSGASEYLGFFYFRGKFNSYAVPGMATGGTTSVDGINNFGGFCGYTANPPFSQWNAFVSSVGKTDVFTVNGSTDAFCQGINDRGVAVGAYYDSAGVLHGWVRTPWNGEVKTFDAPGASTVLGSVPCASGLVAGTTIYGINDWGEMVGHYWDTSNVEHGFVLHPDGSFQKIDVPGAALISGGAVNNFGQVAGHYVDSSCISYGFIGTPQRDKDDD
jgi:hypothetical protein